MDKLEATGVTEPAEAPACGPLAGITVLDLTRLLPGAFGTQILADLGARVIKIEEPGLGDYWRWSEPKLGGQGAQFLSLNRNKESLTLNLKTVEGRAILLRLCAQADVLIESFRPGVMEKLDLGRETLWGANRRLVICALSGFGQTGPWARLAAHDLNYQGLAGFLHMLGGRPDRPTVPALPLGDLGGGASMAVSGILAALIGRNTTGRGTFVDIGVLDGLASWSAFLAAQWSLPERSSIDVPYDEPYDRPFYTVYETLDGRHLVVGAYEEKFWQRLCETLGLPDLLPRQWETGPGGEEVRQAIARVIATRTQADWCEVFDQIEACVTPVLNLKEALHSAQANARGMLVRVQGPNGTEMKQVACPIRLEGYNPPLNPPPMLGENTTTILSNIGYDEEQLQRLRNERVI